MEQSTSPSSDTDRSAAVLAQDRRRTRVMKRVSRGWFVLGGVFAVTCIVLAGFGVHISSGLTGAGLFFCMLNGMGWWAKSDPVYNYRRPEPPE